MTENQEIEFWLLTVEREYVRKRPSKHKGEASFPLISAWYKAKSYPVLARKVLDYALQMSSGTDRVATWLQHVEQDYRIVLERTGDKCKSWDTPPKQEAPKASQKKPAQKRTPSKKRWSSNKMT